MPSRWRNITLWSKPLIEIKEQAKFTYSPLGKALEKQTDVLKSLNLSNETDKLK